MWLSHVVVAVYRDWTDTSYGKLPRLYSNRQKTCLTLQINEIFLKVFRKKHIYSKQSWNSLTLCYSILLATCSSSTTRFQETHLPGAPEKCHQRTVNFHSCFCINCTWSHVLSEECTETNIIASHLTLIEIHVSINYSRFWLCCEQISWLFLLMEILFSLAILWFRFFVIWIRPELSIWRRPSSIKLIKKLITGIHKK